MARFDPRFRAGGYFLTRWANRDDGFMSTDLVPERFLTLGGCLSDVALEFWWNLENVAEADNFGVPRRQWPELVSWYLDQFESRIGAPGVAYSTRIIREFADRFVPDPADLIILGAGLDSTSAARLLRECQAPSEQGEYGVYEMLEREVALEEGGTVHGFEVLSYEYGLEHSWLCNSLERDAERALGVTPNDVGLLDTLDDASRVADYINRDDVGAEPGLWLPWQIVQYPL